MAYRLEMLRHPVISRMRDLNISGPTSMATVAGIAVEHPWCPASPIPIMMRLAPHPHHPWPSAQGYEPDPARQACLGKGHQRALPQPWAVWEQGSSCFVAAGRQCPLTVAPA